MRGIVKAWCYIYKFYFGFKLFAVTLHWKQADQSVSILSAHLFSRNHIFFFNQFKTGFDY